MGHAAYANYGNGPFVHGYHAPVPHGGSTGTGIGYWHEDKQKWLLWEPDPLPEPMPKSHGQLVEEGWMKPELKMVKLPDMANKPDVKMFKLSSELKEKMLSMDPAVSPSGSVYMATSDGGKTWQNVSGNPIIKEPAKKKKKAKSAEVKPATVLKYWDGIAKKWKPEPKMFGLDPTKQED